MWQTHSLDAFIKSVVRLWQILTIVHLHLMILSDISVRRYNFWPSRTCIVNHADAIPCQFSCRSTVELVFNLCRYICAVILLIKNKYLVTARHFRKNTSIDLFERLSDTNNVPKILKIFGDQLLPPSRLSRNFFFQSSHAYFLFFLLPEFLSKRTKLFFLLFIFDLFQFSWTNNSLSIIIIWISINFYVKIRPRFMT